MYLADPEPWLSIGNYHPFGMFYYIILTHSYDSGLCRRVTRNLPNTLIQRLQLFIHLLVDVFIQLVV